MTPSDWSVVILTGGGSRRMGRDKASVTVGGRTLLDRLLCGLPAAVPVVVVGPQPEDPVRSVVVTREDPPGAGPLAGVGAGIALVATPLTVIAAVDLPHAAPAIPGLAAELRQCTEDAVVPRAGERLQPLLAAYRTDVLRTALAEIGDLNGRPVREILQFLTVRVIDGDPVAHADVDTPDELARARTIMAPNEEDSMEEWLAAVSTRLGVPGDVDVDLVLDVARDAAHQVERPAAPLTTYLLGLAVASGRDPVEAAALVRDLATGWNPDDSDDD